MDNIENNQKKEIEYLHETIHGLKNEFLHISESIQLLDQKNPDIDTLNRIQTTFSRAVFTVEEIGKRASALFSNNTLYKDSTELSKFFHQTSLKVESLKEAFLARDRAGYAKYLSSLRRTMSSAEYVLSLFIGELTAEITAIMFKKEIQEKKAQDLGTHREELARRHAERSRRVEVCEQRLALFIQKYPQDILESDEASILDEIKKLHDQNVAWVEPRFIEKKLPISKTRITQVFDELTKYGILQYKVRGGTKVFKYGDKDDLNTN